MYQDAKGRPKVVRYWEMTSLHGEFAPNREVDQLVWVDLDEARKRLSYEFDRDLVGQLDPGGVDGRRNPPRYELYRRKWPIFAVTMIGLFMALIDVTIVMSLSPASPSKVDQSPELPPLGPSRPGSRSTWSAAASSGAASAPAACRLAGTS